MSEEKTINVSDKCRNCDIYTEFCICDIDIDDFLTYLFSKLVCEPNELEYFKNTLYNIILEN